jgi:hypothetical protein
MPEPEEKEIESAEVATEKPEEAEVVPHGADEDEELPICFTNFAN